jgi:hypothetical protein
LLFCFTVDKVSVAKWENPRPQNTERQGKEMNSYELMALLTKKEKDGLAEWCETTTVEAKSLDEAGKMAKRFGKNVAIENGARLEDAYAICDETGEQSN